MEDLSAALGVVYLRVCPPSIPLLIDPRVKIYFDLIYQVHLDLQPVAHEATPMRHFVPIGTRGSLSPAVLFLFFLIFFLSR